MQIDPSNQKSINEPFISNEEIKESGWLSRAAGWLTGKVTDVAVAVLIDPGEKAGQGTAKDLAKLSGGDESASHVIDGAIDGFIEWARSTHELIAAGKKTPGPLDSLAEQIVRFMGSSSTETGIKKFFKVFAEELLLNLGQEICEHENKDSFSSASEMTSAVLNHLLKKTKNKIGRIESDADLFTRKCLAAASEHTSDDLFQAIDDLVDEIVASGAVYRLDDEKYELYQAVARLAKAKDDESVQIAQNEIRIASDHLINQLRAKELTDELFDMAFKNHKANKLVAFIGRHGIRPYYRATVTSILYDVIKNVREVQRLSDEADQSTAVEKINPTLDMFERLLDQQVDKQIFTLPRNMQTLFEGKADDTTIQFVTEVLQSVLTTQYEEQKGALKNLERLVIYLFFGDGQDMRAATEAEVGNISDFIQKEAKGKNDFFIALNSASEGELYQMIVREALTQREAKLKDQKEQLDAMELERRSHLNPMLSKKLATLETSEKLAVIRDFNEGQTTREDAVERYSAVIREQLYAKRALILVEHDLANLSPGIGLFEARELLAPFDVVEEADWVALLNDISEKGGGREEIIDCARQIAMIPSTERLIDRLMSEKLKGKLSQDLYSQIDDFARGPLIKAGAKIFGKMAFDICITTDRLNVEERRARQALVDLGAEEDHFDLFKNTIHELFKRKETFSTENELLDGLIDGALEHNLIGEPETLVNQLGIIGLALAFDKQKGDTFLEKVRHVSDQVAASIADKVEEVEMIKSLPLESKKQLIKEMMEEDSAIYEAVSLSTLEGEELYHSMFDQVAADELSIEIVRLFVRNEDLIQNLPVTLQNLNVEAILANLLSRQLRPNMSELAQANQALQLFRLVIDETGVEKKRLKIAELGGEEVLSLIDTVVEKGFAIGKEWTFGDEAIDGLFNRVIKDMPAQQILKNFTVIAISGALDNAEGEQFDDKLEQISRQISEGINEVLKLYRDFSRLSSIEERTQYVDDLINSEEIFDKRHFEASDGKRDTNADALRLMMNGLLVKRCALLFLPESSMKSKLGQDLLFTLAEQMGESLEPFLETYAAVTTPQEKSEGSKLESLFFDIAVHGLQAASKQIDGDTQEPIKKRIARNLIQGMLPDLSDDDSPLSEILTGLIGNFAGRVETRLLGSLESSGVLKEGLKFFSDALVGSVKGVSKKEEELFGNTNADIYNTQLSERILSLFYRNASELPVAPESQEKVWEHMQDLIKQQMSQIIDDVADRKKRSEFLIDFCHSYYVSIGGQNPRPVTNTLNDVETESVLAGMIADVALERLKNRAPGFLKFKGILPFFFAPATALCALLIRHVIEKGSKKYLDSLSKAINQEAGPIVIRKTVWNLVRVFSEEGASTDEKEASIHKKLGTALFALLNRQERVAAPVKVSSFLIQHDFTILNFLEKYRDNLTKN